MLRDFTEQGSFEIQLGRIKLIKQSHLQNIVTPLSFLSNIVNLDEIKSMSLPLYLDAPMEFNDVI